jgi:hypothetical protein
VRFPLDAAGATDRDHLVADDTAMLERALVVVRRECPGVMLSRQHAIAAIDPTQLTRYAFRGGTAVR